MVLWRGFAVWGCLLLFSATASARPPHKQSLKNHYGDLLPTAMASCTTCHFTQEQAPDPSLFDESAPPHNAFGDRLRVLMEQRQAAGQPADIPTLLRIVATEDADLDGVINELEILAGSSAGIKTETPTAEALATANDKARQMAQWQSQYAWQPFLPVIRPAVPTEHATWSRTPIDQFIAAEHAARGLHAREEAPRHVLLRRVYLDLIGLPPTRIELQAFLQDTSPDAYEKVVERLLASPHYGERWGRHWMDVWRYSDWAGWTDGGQIRDSQPHIWRWRDWIVESLNADRGYDQMVTSMLAADELTPTDSSELRATGYLARNYKMLSRETWMQDTVNHTTLAFLGLTVGCARCHDHMYDAITQDEYYQFRAIFEPHQVRLDRIPGQPDTKLDGLARVFDADAAVPTYLFTRGDDRAPETDRVIPAGVPALLGLNGFAATTVTLPAPARYAGLNKHVQQETLAAAEAEVQAARTALDTLLASGSADAAAMNLARQQLAAAEATVAFHAARALADSANYAQPRPAYADALAQSASRVEREASYLKSEAEVLKLESALATAQAALKPDDDATKKAVADAEKALMDGRAARDTAIAARDGVNASYSPLGTVHPETSTGRRTALARWITDRQNPLAARVAVNHLWLRHFGQALVPTTFDFGQNGQRPSHPALLDWLAVELMEPTTLQPGETAPAPWSMKHLHRMIVLSSVYRMASNADAAGTDAQNIARDRDNRFLWRMPSRRMEAEIVRDSVLYVAGQLDATMGGADIDHAVGLTNHRRSIYFRHAQEKQMEFLKMFDAAAVTECYERKQSIIPQQALALANSELTLVQARHLARSLHAQSGSQPLDLIHAAFEQVLSRPATSQEQETCMAFLNQQQQLFVTQAEQVAATAGEPTDASKPSADPSLRALENLVHVLLNHNDFVTIR